MERSNRHRAGKANKTMAAFDKDDGEKHDKIRRNDRRMTNYFVAAAAICLVLTVAIVRMHPGHQPDSSGNAQAVASMGAEPPIHLKLPPLAAQPLTAESLQELEDTYKELDKKVREIKKTGVIMETDKESLKWTHKLQEATRKLLYAKYGHYDSYRIRVNLEFPPTIPDFAEKGKDGTLVLEMAPISLIPVSVYTFLEIARTWRQGVFHRNAGHVLQATSVSAIKDHLPFQEYSDHHPHKKFTTGYCGRPSGPCWYISIRDNTKNHGPGSQQDHNPYEADANFGRVVEGTEDVVPRIHSTKATGWLDKKDQIKITKMTILVPDASGVYVPWTEPALATS